MCFVMREIVCVEEDYHRLVLLIQFLQQDDDLAEMELERNEFAANIGVDQFIGSCVVKNLSELVECDNSGVFIVPACYDGIYEGVDMWLSDSAGKMIPRYRLKINVEDDADRVVFSLFDEKVKTLVPETCRLLAEMAECSSIYPHNVNLKLGDVVVFKVEKNEVLRTKDEISFSVVDMRHDSDFVDAFFEHIYPYLSSNVSSSSELIPSLKVEIPGCVKDEFNVDGEIAEVRSMLASSLKDEVLCIKNSKRGFSCVEDENCVAGDGKKLKLGQFVSD